MSCNTKNVGKTDREKKITKLRLSPDSNAVSNGRQNISNKRGTNIKSSRDLAMCTGIHSLFEMDLIFNGKEF